MIKLKETNTYKPFMYDEMLVRNIELQESLGFGRVREVALRDDEVGEMSDLEVGRRRQANVLAGKFPVLDLRRYDGDEFRHWDDLLIVDHVPIPVFEARQHGGNYGCSYRPNTFQTKRATVNGLVAKEIGCEPIDFVETPPEWALISFPKGTCKHNCLAMQMSDEKQAEFKDKFTDDEAFEMYRKTRRNSWSDDVFTRSRESMLREIDLEWVAGIPLFPSTALELAGRVKKISDDAKFMLLFQPEWEYKQIEMPKLDPVLIVWHPTDDHGNEGIWLKVCEWGRDVMELEESDTSQ